MSWRQKVHFNNKKFVMTVTLSKIRYDVTMYAMTSNSCYQFHRHDIHDLRLMQKYFFQTIHSGYIIISQT